MDPTKDSDIWPNIPKETQDRIKWLKMQVDSYDRDLHRPWEAMASKVEAGDRKNFEMQLAKYSKELYDQQEQWGLIEEAKHKARQKYPGAMEAFKSITRRKVKS